MPNPAVVDDRAWVVYPWISGRPYAGSLADVAAAGDLLGRIHRASTPDLPITSMLWPEYEPGEPAQDLPGLHALFACGARNATQRL